jgi:hypothetical protein
MLYTIFIHRLGDITNQWRYFCILSTGIDIYYLKFTDMTSKILPPTVILPLRHVKSNNFSRQHSHEENLGAAGQPYFTTGAADSAA